MSNRRILNVAGTALLALIVLPFVVYAVPQLVGASHGYVVLSDSMEPTIQAGDVVIVDGVSASQIDEGDIITFRRSGDDSKVTHRVVEVVQKDGGTYYRTKGDANEEADAKLVPAENVIGVVMFNIPFIGHVVDFGSTTLGTVLLILVPAALLILNELLTLYRAATASEEPEDEAEDWDWVEDPMPKND